MKRNTYSDGDGEPQDANAYWRRRVIILTAGLGMLGVGAWLVSGNGGPGAPGSARSAAARQAAVTAQQAANGLPSQAFGTSSPPAQPASATMPGSWGSPPDSGQQAQPGRPAKPAKAGKAGKRGKAAGKGRNGGRGAKDRLLAGQQGRCPEGDVVLSLFTSKLAYGPHESARFAVYAVSTASHGCTFRFGTGTVRVVVANKRRVVWDSDSCVPGSAKTVRLARGVPAVMSVRWNPDVSSPRSCQPRLPANYDGWLKAIAVTSHQLSPPHYFELLR